MSAEKNQAHVSEFLDMFHESAEPDFRALMRYFSPAAKYQPLVPMRVPSQGHDGIVAELERQYLFYKECTCTIHSIAASENHVFTERTDTVTLKHDGKRVETRLNAVFDIDRDGLISGWREYYDSGDLVKKLGVTLADFETIMAAA